MNLSFFAYITDSTDEKYPASTFMTTKEPMHRGKRDTVQTGNGSYDLVGLDAITYEDEADLVQQVNEILKEMGI